MNTHIKYKKRCFSINYFNLNEYEEEDFKFLMIYHKNFDGFSKVKLNAIDKLISKEHKYGYYRMNIFGLFMICGLFIPVYLLLGVVLSNELCSFLICIGIGILLQIIYENSCDKIDYNYLVSKITQVNIFEMLEKD